MLKPPGCVCVCVLVCMRGVHACVSVRVPLPPRVHREGLRASQHRLGREGRSMWGLQGLGCYTLHTHAHTHARAHTAVRGWRGGTEVKWGPVHKFEAQGPRGHRLRVT